MSVSRVVAAAGSLAVTALVLIVVRATHPPAGATTLIVSLGLLRTPSQLVVAACSVVAVTAVDWLFNRATGQAMPVWSGAGNRGDRRDRVRKARSANEPGRDREAAAPRAEGSTDG
jgi:CBS-domain-containing membrane protein